MFLGDAERICKISPCDVNAKSRWSNEDSVGFVHSVVPLLLERDGKDTSKNLTQKGRWHVHHWIRHYEPKLTISIPRVQSNQRTPSTRQQQLVLCHDCVNMTHFTLITVFVLLSWAATLYKHVAQIHSITRHKANVTGLQLNQTMRINKELKKNTLV
jgi:hypothetical protein